MSSSSSRRASSLGSSLQDAHVQLVRRRMCVQLRLHLPEVGPEMVVVVVVPPPSSRKARGLRHQPAWLEKVGCTKRYYLREIPVLLPVRLLGPPARQTKFQ